VLDANQCTGWRSALLGNETMGEAVHAQRVSDAPWFGRNTVMTKQQPLPYLPAMFATCMLFQASYLACVILWFIAPNLSGHALLIDIFPQFKLLDAPSFIYGLILSGLYGWFASAVFVFFYNLWPSITGFLSGSRAAAA
jgi:CHASE2 domain-containing sensor protein